MRNFLMKRLGSGTLAVFCSIVFNFYIMRLAPGDPSTILAGRDNPNPEMIAMIRERYGLDKPIYEQLIMYLKQLLSGDLGYSFTNNRDVIDLIAERVVPTFMIALVGVLISVVIGTLIGVYAARKKGTAVDQFICGISYFFDSTPSFWLGLMLILLFASVLGIFPTSGMENLRAHYTGFKHVLDVIHHMFLPVLTLVLLNIPYYFRIARSSVLQVMSEDFIMTLRATGMSERRIFNKYVLRNSIIPTITVLGINLAYMITGVSMIEITFSWPGMGRLVLDSISKRDYPVVSGVYVLLSLSVALGMIAVDLIYALVDPRIRIE